MAEQRWGTIVPSRSEQRDLKLEALLQAAAQSFNKKGFHGTSLADLAREFGVTKPALYHYVSNKQELLFRCHMISLSSAVDAIHEAEASSGNGLERIRVVVYNYLRAITENPTACLVIFEDGALDGDHTKEVLATRDGIEGKLREFVAMGIADGSIVPCDPKMAVFTLLGAINWVSRWHSPEGAWNGDSIAHAMTEQLLRSLARQPADTLPTSPRPAPSAGE